MHFTLLHHKTLLLNQQMSFKMSGSIKNEHTHTQKKKSIMYSYSLTYVHYMVRFCGRLGA